MMNHRPNFVFIMTDTQATNAIGAYGRPELQTPNIDRLAQTGIKFENAYTTCPLCTPARAGLMDMTPPTSVNGILTGMITSAPDSARMAGILNIGTMAGIISTS